MVSAHAAMRYFGSPIGIRTYNPLVNSPTEPASVKSNVWCLFFSMYRGSEGKRQELTWLGVPRIGSCMAK